MKKFLKLLMVLSSISCLVMACQNNNEYNESNVVKNENSIMIKNKDGKVVNEINYEKILDENNKFSIGINSRNKKILSYLDFETEHKNLVFSNTGIESVVEMARLAASGDTKKEIENVFGIFDKNLDSEVVKTYNYIVINKNNDDKVKPKEEYLKNFTEQNKLLSGDLIMMDKTNTPKIIADMINKKVSKVTNDFLNNVTSEKNYVDETFIAELSNTIYFKDNWQNGEIESRKYVKFKNFDGSISKNEFLTPTDENRYLLENDDVIGFALPYQSEYNRYYFVGIISKDEKKKIEDINITNIPFYLDKYILNVSFPKFEIENDIDLIALFKELGIKNMISKKYADFGDGFDFDKSKYNIYISDGSQKAKIEVNEKGTEAAAYSRLAMNFTTAAFQKETPKIKIRNVELNFNRPFIYMIYDTKESTPIFIGKTNEIEKSEIEEALDVETIKDEIIEVNMNEKYVNGEVVKNIFFDKEKF